MLPAPPTPTALVFGLRDGLMNQQVAVEKVIAEFGQVRAGEDRAAGRTFSFGEHLRGLVFSLLSSQRPWGPIHENRDAIAEIFGEFDPEFLKAADPARLEFALRAIRCGNRAIGRQTRSLAANVSVMEQIVADFGSLDAFVTSGTSGSIADRLAKPGSPYKLAGVGLALAMEYLRNVGIYAGKPDLHVLRILGPERLGLLDDAAPTACNAVGVIDRLAAGAGCNATYLDNLLWMFCATDYGNICSATPRCDACGLAASCREGAGRVSR